jgi:hypothetical protein
MSLMFRVVVALFLCLLHPVWLQADDGAEVSALRADEVQILRDFLSLMPGMSEADVRRLFPNLGTAQVPQDRGAVIALSLPEFTFSGLKWSGRFRLVEGKLTGARLWASALYPGIKSTEWQTAPREDVRAAGLRMAAWFQRRIGKVTERYVPDLDCPGGNPYGLRHTWLTRRRAVALEFHKNASMSSLTLSLADWSAWNLEQKANYSGWPLKPALPEHLREAARPQR